MSFREVAKEDELWVGEMRAVGAGKRRIVLIRTEAGVTAFRDRCPHLGVPLSEGTLDGRTLTCSAHHFEYDAATGRGINPKCLELTKLAVRCDAGAIWVDLGGELGEETS